MKRLTREERRRRGKLTRIWITYFLFLILLIAVVVFCLSMPAEADSAPETITEEDDGRLPGDDTPATERCYLTDEDREAAENELIEAALLSAATRLDNVTVSHSCTCSTCCGKSDGITASGRQAVPGVSVAVDTDVIPMGADVLVDYGDGVIHYYHADDTGSAVQGNHIDLCMESHEAALQAGIRTATVYYIPEGAIQ